MEPYIARLQDQHSTEPRVVAIKADGTVDESHASLKELTNLFEAISAKNSITDADEQATLILKKCERAVGTALRRYGVFLSREDKEDISKDSAIKAWKLLSSTSVDMEQDLDGIITRKSYDTVHDWFRKNERTINAISTTSDTDEVFDVEDSSVDEDVRYFDSKSAIESTGRAAGISQEDLRLVWLVLEFGVDTKVISRSLGINYDALRKRVQRAIKKLKSALNAE